MTDAADLSMAKSALWTLFVVAIAACGPPPGMPPSPVNPPVKPPPPQTTSWDGEVIGADRQAPADRLAEGAQVVVRPADGAEPARVELAPGWYADERGVVYSREEQQRMVGSPSAGPGTWEIENGVRVYRPRAPKRQPVPSTGATNEE
jgi:hypothetical protein